jgi:uncharacterized membrane protein YbhN (UPF0104 family)
MAMDPGRRLLWWRVASTALGILAIVVAVLVMRRDQAARDALGLLTLPVLGLTLAFGLGNVASDSYRFHALLPDGYRHRIGMWNWHGLYATGRLLNLLVPQAGGAYRAAQLRVEYGIPIATFYGTMAATTGLAAAMSWVFAGAIVIAGAPLLGSIVLALGVVSLVGFALVVRRLGRMPAVRPEAPGRAGRLARRFAEGFLNLADRRRFVQVLGWSLLSQVCGAVVLVVVCVAFDVPNPIVVGAALYAGASVASVVSLTPGGLGLTELAAGLAAYLVDLGAGVGVLIALVARVTGTLAVMVVAGVATLVARRVAHRGPES